MTLKYQLEFENPKKFDYKNLKIGTIILIKEAFRRKIKVSKPIGYSRILEYKGQKHILREHETDQVGRPSVRVTNEKQTCKEFLASVGLPVPDSKVFQTNELKQAIEYFEKTHKKVVLKPAASDYGNCVFLNVDSVKKLKKAFKKIKRRGYRVLIEEQFDGEEIRLFVTEKGYVCSIKRFPANVIGDGVTKIKELVQIKNKLKSSKLKNNHGKKYMIQLGKLEKSILKEKGFTINSIPKKGEMVFLRQNSNLSTGGDSIDVTDEIHPSIKKIAVTAIKAIPGIGYCGVDLITKKPLSKPHTYKDYIIIEINNLPGIFGHHMPYQGKSRNAAGAILDMLFQQ